MALSVVDPDFLPTTLTVNNKLSQDMNWRFLWIKLLSEKHMDLLFGKKTNIRAVMIRTWDLPVRMRTRYPLGHTTSRNKREKY
jgi:hypothetical protein